MIEILLILNTVLLLAVLGIVFPVYRKLNPKDSWNESLLGDGDELYDEAKRIIIKKQQASASMLQRELRIGYARATRLLDLLEEKGIIGSAHGAEPREALEGKD